MVLADSLAAFKAHTKGCALEQGWEVGTTRSNAELLYLHCRSSINCPFEVKAICRPPEAVKSPLSTATTSRCCHLSRTIIPLYLSYAVHHIWSASIQNLQARDLAYAARFGSTPQGARSGHWWAKLGGQPAARSVPIMTP